HGLTSIHGFHLLSGRCVHALPQDGAATSWNLEGWTPWTAEDAVRAGLDHLPGIRRGLPQGIHPGPQLVDGTGQVRHQSHVAPHGNENRLVLRPQDLLEKLLHGSFMLLDEPYLTPADIDNEPDRERQVGLAPQILNGASLAVVPQNEILLAQVGHGPSVAI